MLAAVAMFSITVSLISIWWNLRPPATPKEQINLAGFRGRVVTTALRMYRMDLETSDANKIRNYLASNNALADFQLTPALTNTALAGCGVLTWQGAKVSMVCFRSGQPPPSGAKSDLYLFVVDRATVPDAPAEGQTRLEKVSQVSTASWSSDGKVYVLAAEGDEEFLRRFL